jgi:hypothetical protein
MVILVLTIFCGSPGACTRKQTKNWRNEGRGRLGMGRFVVGFRIYWLDASLMKYLLQHLGKLIEAKINNNK